MTVTEDRRRLWQLETFLAVNGTTDSHREARRSLRAYLDETCEHEWADVSGWGGSPQGTWQCRWCNTVGGHMPQNRPQQPARATNSTAPVSQGHDEGTGAL